MGSYGQTYDCQTLSHGARKKRKVKEVKRGISAILRSVKIGKASTKNARSKSQKAWIWYDPLERVSLETVELAKDRWRKKLLGLHKELILAKYHWKWY